MTHRSANENSVARRVRQSLLATAAVLLPVFIAGTAFAQSGAQPRAIPKGFVLPGPAPTGTPSQTPATAAPSANPQAAPKSASEASGIGNADSTSAREGRPMDFAKTPEAGKTNWPCIQQKLGSIQPAQVWAGPPIAETATEKLTPEENRLIDSLAARRTTIDEASKMVEDYVDQQPKAERQAIATRIMAGLLGQLNVERSEVMDGIERYGAKQKALAQRLREQSSSFAKVQRSAASSNNDIENARQALLWDTRVFDERRKSLSYVCEVPTLIEQRAFALGRAIASTL